MSVISNINCLEDDLMTAIFELKEAVVYANLSEKLTIRPFAPMTTQQYIDMWCNEENVSIGDLIKRFRRETNTIINGVEMGDNGISDDYMSF